MNERENVNKVYEDEEKWGGSSLSCEEEKGLEKVADMCVGL